MGQVVVEFGKGGSPSKAGGVAQVFEANPQSEELSSSGTSAATTITADAGDVAVITNNGGAAIWVTFGASPVAAVETTSIVLAGQVRDFGPMGKDFKAAVIDDS